jgi:hypothetical protein
MKSWRVPMATCGAHYVPCLLKTSSWNRNSEACMRRRSMAESRTPRTPCTNCAITADALRAADAPLQHIRMRYAARRGSDFGTIG